MPKPRSNTIDVPLADIAGHSTRPSVKLVSWRADAPALADCSHRLAAPLRSETKNIVAPSGLHIGQPLFAPSGTIGVYVGMPRTSRTRSISLSSRWLCPLRHH